MTKHDPKYEFGAADVLWRCGDNNDGYIVPLGEPVMVLRGKDVTSLVAICAYIEALDWMDMHPVVKSQLESSFERLRTFYKYQIDKDKQGVIDSQKHHSGFEKILERAKNIIENIEEKRQ